MRTTIAGLAVEFYPAPSNATDSETICFPQLKLAINNLLWPALFNVFAIRGEEYRGPRIWLRGLDELNALGADHLIGAHGPPMSGAAEIVQCTRDSRLYTVYVGSNRALRQSRPDPERDHCRD